jgi:hypothetical protein
MTETRTSSPEAEEQLSALRALSEQPGIKITATIHTDDVTKIHRGLPSVVTVSGTKPDGTSVGEPIHTTSSVICQIEPTKKTPYLPVIVAYNVALREALFAFPLTPKPPTSVSAAGR